MTGYFKLTEGFVNCPKCGGWQILDKTKRGANGWPIGEIIVESCDFCNGSGEVKEPEPIWDIDEAEPPIKVNPISPGWKPAANPGWGAKPMEPGPVSYIEPPKPEQPKDNSWGNANKGWATFNKDK